MQDQYACTVTYTIIHNNPKVLQINNAKSGTGSYFNVLRLNNTGSFRNLGLIKDNHSAHCTGAVVQEKICTARKRYAT